MTNITNINSQRFTMNGISYYKNFLSQIIGDPIVGNMIRIVNAYDSKFELLRATKISNISVNGLTYPNAAALQMALLPILYSRSTLGDGSSSENGIVQMGPLELIENTTTVGSVDLKIPIVPVLPIWRIGGIEYTKLTETRINIPPAAEGYYRIDTIVANTANGFERIVGEERMDVGVPPQLPYNVLVVTQINIFGDIVNDGDPTPPPPPPLGKFITKSSKRYRIHQFNNPAPQELYLSQEYTTHLIKREDSPSNNSKVCNGFVIDTTSEDPDTGGYDGMDIFVKNDSNEPITLKHNIGSVDVPFWFQNAQDLTVLKNEVLHFKYNIRDNRVDLVNGGSLQLGETPTTAHRGDHGKTAYDHSQVTSGNPHNVTPFEIGTYTATEIDELISVPSQSIKTGNFTLAPTENNKTVAMDGGTCTVNPNTEIYPDAYVVAMQNTTDGTDGSIVCTAATGWTYKLNDNASVASGTFTFPAGATVTIIKYLGTNKIYINGGVE